MTVDDFIQTYTGKEFCFLDPEPEDIDIRDIAHALSNICRFTGHSNNFYSVAQHSVYVSCYVEEENALRGLLHDASEAYVNDISRPLKHLPFMEKYREIEDKIEKTIIKKFGLSNDKPPNIKEVDIIVMVTEARDLGLMTPNWKHYHIKPLSERFVPWLPVVAEKKFMERYEELVRK